MTTNQGLTTLGVAVRAVRLKGVMSDPIAYHEGVVHSSEAGHQPAGIGEHHLSTTPLGDRRPPLLLAGFLKVSAQRIQYLELANAEASPLGAPQGHRVLHATAAVVSNGQHVYLRGGGDTNFTGGKRVPGCAVLSRWVESE